MTDIEKNSNKNSIKTDKEKNEIFEQNIGNDETSIVEYENKQIEDVDEWKISDIFDINYLERIKQTPEYIIGKNVSNFINFINLKGYFFIMKPNENWKNLIKNMKNNKDSEKEKENKKQSAIKKTNEIDNKEKEKVYKNDIYIKQKDKEGKNYESEKKDKIKKEFSNSIDIKKSNQLLNKYNLNINVEKKNFSNSLNKKKINTLNKEEKKIFLKRIYNKKNEFFIKDNNAEENKNFCNSFIKETKDLLLYNEKELNNNLINSSSTSKNEINKKINSSDFSSSDNNIKDSSSTCKIEFEINQQINSYVFLSNNNSSSFNNMPLSDSYSSFKIKDDKKIEEKEEKKIKK